MIRFLPRSTLRLGILPVAILTSQRCRRRFQASTMAETLPPLSRQDRDKYGRMGATMEMFHNSFRQTWKLLYSACSSGQRPPGMSIRQFLNTGAEFCHHLEMHHSIGTPHPPILAQELLLTVYPRGTAHLSRPGSKDARLQARTTASDAA